MKQFKILILALFLFVILFFQSYLSRADLQNVILNNFVSVEYQKDSTLTNTKFVDVLNKYDVNFMIIISKVQDSKTETTYFIKDEPMNLENLYVTEKSDSFVLKEDKTKYGQIKVFKDRNDSIILEDINNLKELRFNLDKNTLFIDKDHLSEELLDKLSDDGININRDILGGSTFLDFSIFIYLFAAVFIIYLLLLEVFELISESKKMGIYKLNGISVKEYVREKLNNLYASIVISVTIALIPFLLFLLFEQRINLFVWTFEKIGLLIFLFFAVYVAFVFIVSRTFYNKVKVSQYLKNKMDFKYVLILLNGFKILFTILIAFNLLAVYTGYNDYVALKGELRKYEEIGNYYTITNKGELMDDYPDAYKNFYLENDDAMEGILVYSDPYYSGQCYNQPKYISSCYTVVNNQYLEKNPVYLASGEIFNPEDYNKEENLILIPEDLKEEEEEFIGEHNITISDADREAGMIKERVLYTQANQDLFSYNLFNLNGKSDSFMRNPVIYYVNENMEDYIFENAMGNGDGNYFVRADSPEEILDKVKNTPLEEHVKIPYLKQDEASEALQTINRKYQQLMIPLVLNLIIFVFIIMYTINLKILKDGKDIAIKKLYGYNFVEIYYPYYYDSIFSAVILFTMFYLVGGGNYSTRSLIIVPVIMIVIEVVIKTCVILFKQKNIISELKGKE